MKNAARIVAIVIALFVGIAIYPATQTHASTDTVIGGAQKSAGTKDLAISGVTFNWVANSQNIIFITNNSSSATFTNIKAYVTIGKTTKVHTWKVFPFMRDVEYLRWDLRTASKQNIKVKYIIKKWGKTYTRMMPGSRCLPKKWVNVWAKRTYPSKAASLTDHFARHYKKLKMTDIGSYAEEAYKYRSKCRKGKSYKHGMAVTGPYWKWKWSFPYYRYIILNAADSRGSIISFGN